MASEDLGVPQLELEHIIGFNGRVPGGLSVHPNNQHLIYPLGCTIIIEDISTKAQEFLLGHSDEVTSVVVSNSGKYIASGQRIHMGFKAEIIIWDFETRCLHAMLKLHKVKVEAMAFSPNDIYLASLGGPDDGSVVIWDIATKSPICGSQAQVESAGTTCCVCFSNTSDFSFVTGGNGTLRVWDLDLENRKIRPTDVQLGQLKREIKYIVMADNYKEPFFLCATTTGDIIGVNMSTYRFQFHVPEKEKFSLGVTSMALLKNGNIVIGAGDGTICMGLFNEQSNPKTNKLKVDFEKKMIWKNPKLKGKVGAVTSLALRGSGHQFYAGTDNSEIYKLNAADLKGELINTCHSSGVNDIVFPHATSRLFLTCQLSELRVWLLDEKKELIRQEVPNMNCNAIDITKDGTAIVTAWDDGKIRAFSIQHKPPKLCERFVVADAHKMGVTAVACTSDGMTIVSGGGEGQVRVWKISGCYQNDKKKHYTASLVAVMKEHNGSVSDIKIRKNDRECVSASSDGTCILWDLANHKRLQIVFANTLFKCVCYGPGECQIITSGTDRKVTYSECCDGSHIRELEGSKSGSVNSMDMSADYKYFVSGGDDKILKLWKYDEGEVAYAGIGHSGSIAKVRICPNQKHIVSVSADGAVLIWKFPWSLN